MERRLPGSLSGFAQRSPAGNARAARESLSCTEPRRLDGIADQPPQPSANRKQLSLSTLRSSAPQLCRNSDLQSLVYRPQTHVVFSIAKGAHARGADPSKSYLQCKTLSSRCQYPWGVRV